MFPMDCDNPQDIVSVQTMDKISVATTINVAGWETRAGFGCLGMDPSKGTQPLYRFDGQEMAEVW